MPCLNHTKGFLKERLIPLGVFSINLGVSQIISKMINVILAKTYSLMHFLPFSYLVVMARTFNTLLNKSGKGGHLCLVLDLRGKAFSFSLLSTLAVDLSYLAFIILRYVPSIPTF